MYRFPSAARHQKKFGPAGNRREHSARCEKPAKPGKTHATAIIDDERGHFLKATHAGETTRIDLRIPSPPRHVENRRNSSKSPWKLRACIHSRTKHCALPIVAPTGTTTLSKNWTTPNHCNCGESTVFCATNQSTHTAASIYIPPWPGGAPLKTSNAPSA